MLGGICVWHLQPDVLGSGDDSSSACPQARGSPCCPLRPASEHPRPPLCSSSSTTLIPHTKVPAGSSSLCFPASRPDLA